LKKGVSKISGKAGFNFIISSIMDVPGIDDTHPFITVARFVFADDKPNANNQVVDYSEFDNIKNSAVGMPVKMKFTGSGVGEHEGSVPIGTIQSMEEITNTDGSHQLVAQAMLWKEEFPEEVQYLKDTFAAGDAPGISYELGYADSETKNGLQFIKRIVTLAATFVKHPAYGTRTRLLALAAMEVVTAQDIAEATVQAAKSTNIPLSDVIDILGTLKGSSENPVIEDPMKIGESSEEGGNQMEEELQQAKAMAASLSAEIEALKALIDQKDAEILGTQEEIKGLKLAALVDSRTRRVVEAGLTLEADAEKAEKKKALWASLTDEQFEEYLDDLVTAKKSATPAAAAMDVKALAAVARASTQGNAIPKIESEEKDFNSLKDAIRNIARPNSID
jgi:hypothetical protein